MAVNTDEALLAHLPLTSCCAAQFLPGGPSLDGQCHLSEG